MDILHGWTPSLEKLIPYPTVSLEQAERFSHSDIAGMTNETLWSESTLLTVVLARLLFKRRRPRIINVDATGDPLTDQAWLRDRLMRLRDERRRRAAGLRRAG